MSRTPGLVVLRDAVPIRLLAVLVVAWAVPAAMFGGIPVIPWRFLLALFIFALPVAYAVNLLAAGVERAEGAMRGAVPLLSMAAGLVFVGVLQIQNRAVVVLALGLLVGLLWRLLRVGARQDLRTLGLTAIILALGFGALQNLNYIAVPVTVGRLHDAALREIDLTVYRWLFGDIQYVHLFPLFRSRVLFTLFENAYSALFVELITVVVAFIGSRQHVIKILGSLFLCYLAGIVVFAIYPTLGPFVVYPESLTPAYRFTLTGTLMATLAAEYHAAVQGTSVTGFGYFIAMPSLHAAIATLCQCIFAGRRALFWLFLPVNVLLLGSTVVLGYHYIVDVPTGVLLGATVYVARFRAARPARPDAADTARRYIT